MLGGLVVLRKEQRFAGLFKKSVPMYFVCKSRSLVWLMIY